MIDRFGVHLSVALAAAGQITGFPCGKTDKTFQWLGVITPGAPESIPSAQVSMVARQRVHQLRGVDSRQASALRLICRPEPENHECGPSFNGNMGSTRDGISHRWGERECPGPPKSGPPGSGTAPTRAEGHRCDNFSAAVVCGRGQLWVRTGTARMRCFLSI